jgi:hypothetical protein
MAGTDENRGRSRRPGVEDRGWSSTCRVLGGLTIERSGDAVRGLHHTKGDEKCGFLGLAIKPSSTVSPSLTSKPVASGFWVWALKAQLQFGNLCLKTIVTVSWFVSQNQVGYN